MLKLDNQAVLYSKYSTYDSVKRSLDLCLAATGLIAVLPIIAICALIVILDSPGPAFFTQERIGMGNQIFLIYKLRTMNIDAEASGPQLAIKDDPRVTRIGRFLRKYRIDELPQLLNILKGEMSLVGPRPERETFIKQFSADLPGFSYRTLVRPGLTGWAQVNGGYDLDPAKKLEFDLHYIKHRSLILDAVIIIKTLRTVIKGTGAR